jgi:hypothetical protein
MVARGEVEPPTFRFSEVWIIVRRISLITQVRDLHFFIDLNADERRRTYTDEIKDETTRSSVPGLSCGSP